MKVKSLKLKDEGFRTQVGLYHRVHKPKRRTGQAKNYRKTHIFVKRKLEKLKIQELLEDN